MSKEILENLNTDEENSLEGLSPYKVLVVDDEDLVHGPTKRVLENFTFQNRPLEMLSAYSFQEAKTIVDSTSDLGVIILDVVMETPAAGLELVNYIRKDVHNFNTQIILRTGQPALAPELACVRDFDIFCYLEKSHTTAARLKFAVCTALKSFENTSTICKNLIAAKKQEKMLNRSIAKIQESVELLKRTVFHDFEQHLAAIASAVKHLNLDHNMPKNQSELQKINRVIDSQRDYLKYLESIPFKNELQIKPFAIAPLFDDVALLFEERLREKEIELEYKENILPKNLYVLGERPPIIFIVLNNILANAINYTDRGGSITMTAKSLDDGDVVISVEDNGTGIPSKALRRIFGKSKKNLMQTKLEAIKGQGMPIVRSTIEAQGGSIEIISHDGSQGDKRGTQVNIYLPQALPSNDRLEK